MAMNLVYVCDEEPDDLLARIISVYQPGVTPMGVFVIHSKDDGWNRTQKAKELYSLLGLNCALGTTELALIDFMRKHPDYTYVWTASFALLYGLYTGGDRDLLSQLTIWAYGSVNCRWVLGLLAETEKHIFYEMMNVGFKQLNVFETFFAFGEGNTINADTAPELTRYLLTSDRPEIQWLVQQTRAWNEPLLLEQIEKLRAAFPDTLGDLAMPIREDQLVVIRAIAEDKANKRHTNAKIVRDIWTHLDFQMVAADSSLAAVLHTGRLQDEMVRVKASLGSTGFTVLENSTETSLFYFKPINPSYKWLKDITERTIRLLSYEK